MRGIVEDLLQLSKLEGNPLAEGEGDTINVSAMIHSMVATVRESAARHLFKLELDESLALLGSESEIYSACHNLLTNAVRYTDPGSTIQIRWYAEPDGSAVFCVEDDGRGIEARHLPRLSERFYRVDAGRSRDEGGTGLGLAIVKHAAQRHGGQLTISSTPGTGSQFTITFPPGRTIALRRAANQ
jgi:two-component system phosphate regulon sensor histidine kinase PhoR